jgi:hypothetical protein
MDDVAVRLPLDSDVERLLMGQYPEDKRFEVVVPIISTLRGFRTTVPSPDVIAAVASAAAAVVRGDGPAPARRRSIRSVMVPRLAAATFAVLIVGGVSSMAVAADGSAPGETLYGLDLAMERVGIGAGGVDERLLESALLISTGRSEQAIILLDDKVAQSPEVADPTTAERVELHLNLAENMANSTAEETQEHVASLRQFIEENKGKGVGVDGSEFGQGVSEANPGNGGNSQGAGSSGERQGQGNGEGQGNNGNGQGNNGNGQGNNGQGGQGNRDG